VPHHAVVHNRCSLPRGDRSYKAGGEHLAFVLELREQFVRAFLGNVTAKSTRLEVPEISMGMCVDEVERPFSKHDQVPERAEVFLKIGNRLPRLGHLKGEHLLGLGLQWLRGVRRYLVGFARRDPRHDRRDRDAVTA
jgi:hypothetical protein